eukprot:6483367-Amphidinium_carterae.1
MAALWSQGMYGAEVNGLSRALLGKLRIAGRAALGKGARKRRAAEVELSLAGSAAKDPQVVADTGLIRTWDRWIQRGGHWPPSQLAWDGALLKKGGPLSALVEFASRVRWHPGVCSACAQTGGLRVSSATFYAVPKEIKTVSVKKPIVIYTDGAAEQTTASFGAVLVMPGAVPCWFAGVVPEKIMEEWRREGIRHCIAQTELYTVVVAKTVWAEHFVGEDVV